MLRKRCIGALVTPVELALCQEMLLQCSLEAATQAEATTLAKAQGRSFFSAWPASRQERSQYFDTQWKQWQQKMRRSPSLHC
jgi:hypothetical protein